MLQLINNQDMEFVGLFDHTSFPGPAAPPQDLSALPLSSPSSPPPASSTPPSNTSSILSSSPHLDALLGPPITRSSSIPDKVFLPPTFQQSPLAQLSSTPANPGTLQTTQPKAQPAPSPSLHPPPPAGKSPVFGVTQQVLFSSPQQQPVVTFPIQNAYTGEFQQLHVSSQCF